MAAGYHVHKFARPNGDHDVHRDGCHVLPYPQNRRYLGHFDDCADALKAARNYYRQVNGCYHCSRPCHSG